MQSIFIHGKPVTQGSKKAFVNPKTGRAVMVEDAKKSLNVWRQLIAIECRGWPKLECPVGVTLCFHLDRPKAHYRTGKYSHLLREKAPLAHAQKPDIDKLTRAVLDALTGVAFVDDSQVMDLRATKVWADPLPGVSVQVRAAVGHLGLQEKTMSSEKPTNAAPVHGIVVPCYEELKYGFQYGAAKVTRLFSDEKKGWVTLGIVTPKQTIQVYVTKTGKIRIHDTDGEWFRSSKD